MFICMNVLHINISTTTLTNKNFLKNQKFNQTNGNHFKNPFLTSPFF